MDGYATTGSGETDMPVAKAVWDQIQSNDHRLMRRLHRWRAPRWFRLLMIVATRGGDGWLWYALGPILAIYGGEHRFAAIAAGISAAAVGILLFRVLKQASRRNRPCEIEPHCWAKMPPPDRYSFPSGHAITAFAVAMAIGLFYPELQGCLLGAAFLIAGSRIILGMHFLSDVLVGSAIGVLLGIASFHIFATL
jgi:undecaprenyl-diphosphatase